MTLLERLLENAPAHEPEFEARVYDILGRLVAILPMVRTFGVEYRSEIYAGRPIFAIVVLARDGVGVQTLAHGVEVNPGLHVRADIPEPNRDLSGNW